MKSTASGFPRGLERLRQRLGFACSRGRSLGARCRLFYYAGLQLPLAYRGLARSRPDRVLRFDIQSPSGKEFKVFARDNLYDVETLVEYFSSRRDFLPAEFPNIRPKVIYDVGAHVGFATLFLSTVYPGARVYGFEPLPANFEICARNYKNLPNSRCFPWAVGKESGQLTFEFNPKDLRGGHLSGTGSGRGAGFEKVTVPVFSIADAISRHGLEPPEILKVDAEGAELDVLHGAAEHARGIKALFLETHGPAVHAACLDWLKANNFRIRHAHESLPGYASLWCDQG